MGSLGVSHCILRPAVLFGKEDVLVNNIAWSLRHLPVFGVFGRGDYKLQPIYVDDLAAAAVEKASGGQNEVINAIGPETFTYRELVETVRRSLGLSRLVVGVSASARLLGLPDHGIAGEGRHHHSEGDTWFNGRPAVRGRAAVGSDETDRMGRAP